jgi:hypothetical protein
MNGTVSRRWRLGQTDGQLAIAELEDAVLAASVQAQKATIDDLGFRCVHGRSQLHGA